MEYEEFVRIFRERAAARLAEFEQSVAKAENTVERARRSVRSPQKQEPPRRAARPRKVRRILE